MAKDKIAYVCSNCGQESAKWIGKCPSCHQWNTFKEIRIAADTATAKAHQAAATASAKAGDVGHTLRGERNRPLLLREISAKDEPRIDLNDQESSTVSSVVDSCPVP